MHEINDNMHKQMVVDKAGGGNPYLMSLVDKQQEESPLNPAL